MNTTHTNTTAERYERANGPLTAVIESVPRESWANPSPCEGWAARDVVRHLIETQRGFLMPHGVDLGPDPDVDTDPAAAWRDHSKRVQEALSDDALPAIEYDGHFGTTTVGHTLENFYIFDLVAHRWDIAHSIDRDERFTTEELDQLEAGIELFGDAIYMDGVCKPGPVVAADADRQTQVLAKLGRAA